MNIQVDEKGKLYTDVVRTVAVRATLQTVSHLMQGNIHVRIGDRLKDELDRPGPFLAVTEVEVVAADGRVLFRAPFIAVSRAQIVWVMEAAEQSEEADTMSLIAPVDTARSAFSGGRAAQELHGRSTLARGLDSERTPSEQRGDFVRQHMQSVYELSRLQVSPDVRQIVFDDVVNEMVGYGPIQPLLDDPERNRDHGQRPQQRVRRARRQAGANGHPL